MRLGLALVCLLGLASSGTPLRMSSSPTPPQESLPSSVASSSQHSVFVCTNKWCHEKGAGATLGAFIGLAEEGVVAVQGVNCLGRCNKGPNLRVRRQVEGSQPTWLEFNRIDSVDRVHKILRDYLNVSVSTAAVDCLNFNFQGNAHLDRSEVSEAIECYDKAIETGWADQEGVLLVMRATAYLQRAYSHRRALTALLSRVARDVPNTRLLETIYQVGQQNGGRNPRLVMALLESLANYCAEKESLHQTTKFRYGLYEFSLLRACADSIRATQLLPNYAKCWLRAGDALAELRRSESAADYYARALDLDPSLTPSLADTIARLRLRSVGDASGDPMDMLTF
ncbi:unnamed protein product [Chrysoparadoxa australica]